MNTAVKSTTTAQPPKGYIIVNGELMRLGGTKPAVQAPAVKPVKPGSFRDYATAIVGLSLVGLIGAGIVYGVGSDLEKKSPASVAASFKKWVDSRPSALARLRLRNFTQPIDNFAAQASWAMTDHTGKNQGTETALLRNLLGGALYEFGFRDDIIYSITSDPEAKRAIEKYLAGPAQTFTISNDLNGFSFVSSSALASPAANQAFATKAAPLAKVSSLDTTQAISLPITQTAKPVEASAVAFAVERSETTKTIKTKSVEFGERDPSYREEIPDVVLDESGEISSVETPEFSISGDTIEWHKETPPTDEEMDRALNTIYEVFKFNGVEAPENFVFVHGDETKFITMWRDAKVSLSYFSDQAPGKCSLADGTTAVDICAGMPQ